MDVSVLKSIPISLTVDGVLNAQARQRPLRNRSKMVDVAQRAIERVRALCIPAAVYAELDVQRVDGERATLSDANGQAHVLEIGPHADLLAPATRLFVTVYTIGPALDAHISKLNAAGDLLAAYWLDTAGVLALGVVGETLRCIAEERAAEQGWGVSAALGPGSLAGWSLEGQGALCALLPLEEIGVRLNEHYVLEPHKSVSVAIGLGPGYESHQVGSVCRYCALAESCWRRR